LNLDNTQLNESMLFNICKSLTRSQALLSLHVSGNPGITPELKEFLWRRIRCVDYHEEPIKVVEAPHDDWRKSKIGSKKREEMIKSNVEVLEMSKKAADHGSLTEYATKKIDSEKFLIFTRFLGHKSDIHHSG
jgi:hypothetical protein